MFAAVGWNTHPSQEEDVWKVKNRDQFRKWEVSPVPHKASRFFFLIFVNVTEHKSQWLGQLSGSSLALGQPSTEGPAQEGRM